MNPHLRRDQAAYSASSHLQPHECQRGNHSGVIRLPGCDRGEAQTKCLFLLTVNGDSNQSEQLIISQLQMNGNITSVIFTAITVCKNN